MLSTVTSANQPAPRRTQPIPAQTPQQARPDQMAASPHHALHLSFRSPLTPTEEVGLTSRSPFDGEARKKLILSFMPLADEIANHYANFGREAEELRGEAYLGLTEAASSFDYLSRRPFMDYAAERIRRAVHRVFGWDGASPRIPAAVRSEMRKLSEVETQLYHKLHRRPTNAEIAPYLAATPAKVGELRLLGVKLASLDKSVRLSGEEEGSNLVDLIPEPVIEKASEAEDEVNRAEVEILLQRDCLSDDERFALIHAYGLCGNPDLTHREVGKMAGVSHTTIGNRVAAAIRKLALIPRLRPTWVKHKPKYEAEATRIVVQLGVCAGCGKAIRGWGNTTFRDWQQYPTPAADTPAGTVPFLAVCYRCSRTDTFAQRMQHNQSARHEMLAASSAIRVMVWDYVQQKLVSVVSYATKRPHQPQKQYPPLGCCYCRTAITQGNLGDVVVREVDSRGRYELVGACQTCYQQHKDKWDAAKRERGLVSTPAPLDQAVTAPPKRRNLKSRPDRLTRLARYWKREARKLAAPFRPLAPAPLPGDWDFMRHNVPFFTPDVPYPSSNTFKFTRGQRRDAQRLAADRFIAQLPAIVQQTTLRSQRLADYHAEQERLYRELLADVNTQVAACVALATTGTYQAQVLAYRFLDAADEMWRTADWQPQPVVAPPPPPRPNNFGIGPAANQTSDRTATCNRCRAHTLLGCLTLGPRLGRDGVSYDYAVGLCAACYPQAKVSAVAS